ncbi:CGNR zinc finger domain-containing protein [Mesorhizobium sp. B2-1-8]|uniref:CGNR zinc finger domain-containing protein n=1 Tax=unclassified Mesorhizobium TaxID=325217 RepID=UPI001AEF17C9|nr:MULTISPECIES: CGNR zinc finger domain-containing protein [unclassified Mesorhizobium]MBZ9673619.1 CGNR zinc finger domain-containing protein [Mesorhizobium sp. ES1-3]MBZ9711461.1 CGNR zinc finger domain-containing protein [Mesorhizobium sp. ESP7-2]UCI18402.1 CGNR zinc finger domain-containing protein [Mesorhizobium sp. B2-1-8]
MLGGAPALDIANTLHWRDGAEIDFIPTYQDLLDFCIPALLLSENEGRVLKRLSLNHQGVARDVHLEVLKLRAALKSWLDATVQNLDGGLVSKRTALRGIHKAIAQAGGSAGLGEILNLTSASTHQAIYLPLRRSAAAAVMLVLFPSGNDIRQCEADKCGGFFVNDSRSKPRRWCSMNSCGNRAKAARYRQAHRKMFRTRMGDKGV